MTGKLLQVLLALAASALSLGLALYFFSADASRAERDYEEVNFSQLAFPYKPSGKLHKPIPKEIQGLNGHKVRLDGFMVPVDFKGRQVKSFVLVKDQNACCFGLMPGMSEWVLVTLAAGSQAAVVMDHPVSVMGRLEVGEEVKSGVVVSLYRLEADAVQVSGS